MDRSALARELGRLGGETRARRLGPSDRSRIAALGGRAKHLSRVAEQRIVENLRYLRAVLELRPAPPVKRRRTCAHPLPDLRSVTT
jgi:hypothetical protein